jgi:murein DD-endopeptidase MepM/ murein hydrolase activator NlpD
MESIIAQQKVGRRRPAPAPREAKEPFRYRERSDGPGKRAKPYATRPLQGLNRPSKRQSPAPHPGQGARSRAIGEAALRLRQGLRSLGRRAAGFSALAGPEKAKAATLALSILAAIPVLAVIVSIIAQGPAFPLPPSGLLPDEGSIQNLLLDYVSPELADGKADSDQDGSVLPPAPVTLDLSTYTVRSGDSLTSIAKRFGLYVDTIISANGISNAQALKPGTQLRIPNIDGLIYKVRPGDNLGSLSRKYKVDTTKIVDANDLGSSRIATGMSLFIPGARLPEAAIKQALGQKVAWPLRGTLSSFFGYRPDPFTGTRRFHAGIDIVVNSGTPIRAAMDGLVSDTGYNANYGNYIILNHADGYQTLYGHLSSTAIRTGQRVTQGSLIGFSGNTGYSTGAHLHFGLFKRSLALNPLKYLKQ